MRHHANLRITLSDSGTIFTLSLHEIRTFAAESPGRVQFIYDSEEDYLLAVSGAGMSESEKTRFTHPSRPFPSGEIGVVDLTPDQLECFRLFSLPPLMASDLTGETYKPIERE